MVSLTPLPLGSEIQGFSRPMMLSAMSASGTRRFNICNSQDVGLSGRELVVDGVLDVDNVETSVVALAVSDDTNTTHVATTSDHGHDTSVELDEVLDLPSGEIDLDGVVDLDGRVRVADPVDTFSTSR